MYELWLRASSIIGVAIMVGSMFGIVYLMATWHDQKDGEDE